MHIKSVDVKHPPVAVVGKISESSGLDPRPDNFGIETATITNRLLWPPIFTNDFCNPSGIEVSDADSSAVAPGCQYSLEISGRERGVGSPWSLLGYSSSNLGLNREPNITVACMVLKATINDRCKSNPLPR
ncbi:hypothetical protein TNCV_70701 [Trichonephila clavipes]|nr:hypothetical protein TNCV_70701 [Trichonephila clavipes]